MHHVLLTDRSDEFALLAGTDRSQAAVMTLAPGDDTGERDETEHPEADQWLFVLTGTGEAAGEGWCQALQPGSLLLIAAGEGHRIRATGTAPLRTLNVYAPPHY